MQKKRKIPMRTCMGCRETRPKAELIRVVKPPEGDCFVDRTGRANGRGAYIGDSVACLRKVQKSKALERALEIRIPDEVYEQLAASVKPEEEA